jgi:hypothetical protein
MKRSGILMAVIGLGTGFAAGSFFAPGIRQEIRTTFQPPVVEKQPPIGLAAAQAPEAPPTVAVAAPVMTAANVPALLRDEDTCRRLRGIVALVQDLRVEDLPALVGEVEAGHGPGRDNLLSALAGRWVEVDPRGALADARTRTMRSFRASLYAAYYGGWAQRDPAATVETIAQMPDGEEKGGAVGATLYQIADRDPVQAQALLASVHAMNSDNGNHFIYAQWADQDLDAATQALLQEARFPNRRARSDAIEGIADRLLESDPNSAIDWLAQLPPGTIQDEAQDRVVGQWSRTDPSAALKWLHRLPASDKRNTYIQQVIGKWAGQEPRDALAYAATLPDGPEKNALQQNGADALAHTDGPAALVWAQGQPASPSKNGTVLQVIRNWAEADPAAAAAAVQALPDDPAAAGTDANPPLPLSRQDTFAGVAQSWARCDPARAAAWIGQLRLGPCRDAAVVSYSEQTVSADPAHAIQMVESMSNSGVRNQQLIQLFRTWMQADPRAAATAVQLSSLPDDGKKELLEPPGKTTPP